MAKISLSTVNSGFLSNTTMTLNFTKIASEFQSKVLYRDNPVGEPNTMQQDLDMNGHRVINSLAQSGDGFIWKGNWLPATSYVINNLVTITAGTYQGYTMICLGATTSLSTFDLDYATGKWGIFSMRGASGAGTGDMLKSDNLSGLTNYTTARSNLGAGIGNVTEANVQSQSFTAFTTGGTSSAFTLTPTPALTAYVAGKTRFNVTLNAAPTGSPTIAVSGLAAINAKYYDSTGTKQFITAAVTPLSWVSDVIYDGTDFVWLNTLPLQASSKIQPITASVAANALTVTLNPTTLDFRTTLTSGAVVTLSNAAPISVVIPSTATLGTINAIQNRLALVAMNNAGTIELAVVNIAGGNDLTETNVISTTAIVPSSNSANTFYSTTTRANLAYRVVGYVESTQATAGTWSTAPSTIQGYGGQALAALSSFGFGQTYQDVAGSRAQSTTYYNTKGKAIWAVVSLVLPASGSFTVNINAISKIYTTNVTASAQATGAYLLIPPFGSYSVSGGSSISTWIEYS